jgi:PPP family 3-phenylpropionic acid transporter
MLLQFPFWFGCCTYFSFIVATLVDYGWGDGQAAGAITAMAVISMLIQPVYGYICDRFMSEKQLTVLLLMLAAVSFFGMPFSLGSGSRTLIWLNMTGIAVTAVQVGGLIDAWIVGLKQEHPSINYGIIRGTGSLSYALSAQLAGVITITFGHDARLWLGAVSFVMAAVVAINFRAARVVRTEATVFKDERRITDEKKGSHLRKKEKKSPGTLGGLEAVKRVFSSKQYNLLLAVSFFLLLGNFAMTTLLQLVIPEMGGTAAQIGTAVAVMAGSEVPLMLLVAFILKKIGFQRLLLFCSLAYVIRMFVTASATTVDGLIYAQLFQGITYAILLPLAINYLSQIIDESVRATAVTIYTAVTVSLSAIMANLITSSLLTGGISAQSILPLFALLTTCGLFLTLYGNVRKIW